MTNKRKSFPVFLSWKDSIELLSVEEKAQFLEALFNYYDGEDVQLQTPMLLMFWNSIKHYLKESDEKYQNKVNGGIKAVQIREQNRATAKQDTVPYDTVINNTVPQNELRNRVSKDNDNVNDNVNEKDDDKANVKDKYKVNTNDKFKDKFNDEDNEPETLFHHTKSIHDELVRAGVSSIDEYWDKI